MTDLLYSYTEDLGYTDKWDKGSEDVDGEDDDLVKLQISFSLL